jgi:hypothetical protein
LCDPAAPVTAHTFFPANTLAIVPGSAALTASKKKTVENPLKQDNITMQRIVEPVHEDTLHLALPKGNLTCRFQS